MTKVFVNPPLVGPDRVDGGIRRVVEAQTSLLPEFGVEVVTNPSQADVILNHGALHEKQPGKPMIAAIHGLYWSDYPWPHWGEETNRRVIAVMKAAQAVTVPSRWVGNAVTHGMLVSPTTIYHGVNADEWQPANDWKPYGLWNKARVDPVSDPTDMQELARRLPRVPFLSTFGQETLNVRITGILPYDDPAHKQIIQQAGFGLLTVRETFGIGTLELLAAGVPIVGWDYGGQAEIVKQEETGILVPYGDYNALAEAVIEVLSNRPRYSAAARQDAIERWGWRPRIEQYATLITRLHTRATEPRKKVSVVITNYNLSAFINDAITSVEQQTLDQREIELIIVDDASTDGSVAQIKQRLAQSSLNNPTVLITPKNLGLSGARNYGWRRSEGRYVIFLDADDRLPTYALSELAGFLDHNPETHIAFGGLEILEENGSLRSQPEWPVLEFSWYAQIAHLNQLAYNAMMRREVLEATGGYRIADWRAEDAALWTLATSYGFRATRATPRSTLHYRIRPNSKSGQERTAFPDHKAADGDWTARFPFRLGAESGAEGVELMQRGVFPPRHLVPFGAQGRPPEPYVNWPVYHHQDPVVSIIIPVGAGHEELVIRALDSVRAQTIQSYEVIVIWDAGNTERPVSEYITGHPHARVFVNNGEAGGAGAARNWGATHARAPFLVFLDADDVLLPHALESFLKEWQKAGGYIYCDVGVLEDEKRWDSAVTVYPTPDYDQLQFVSSGYYPNSPGAHGVTIFTAKDDFIAVGGFDAELKFWEDWELMLKYAKEGIEGHRVADALYIYYMGSGRRRSGSYEYEPAIREHLRLLYEPYAVGEKQMCACSGGSKWPTSGPIIAKSLQGSEAPSSQTPIGAGMISEAPIPGRTEEQPTVRLRYVGPMFGATNFKGKVTRKNYKAGLDPLWDTVDAHPDDVEGLLMSGKFMKVQA